MFVMYLDATGELIRWGIIRRNILCWISVSVAKVAVGVILHATELAHRWMDMLQWLLFMIFHVYDVCVSFCRSSSACSSSPNTRSRPTMNTETNNDEMFDLSQSSKPSERAQRYQGRH